MAKQDNSTLNIVLGVLLGPLIGGYFGYRYAKLKHELYALDPNTTRGWDGTFTNILIGTLFGNLAAPLFGYHVAKAELRIEEIRSSKSTWSHTGQTEAEEPIPEQAKGVESSKWRDHIAASPQQIEPSR